MVKPIVISDAPKRFQPFLKAGDNFKGSDKRVGVIVNEEEIKQSLRQICQIRFEIGGKNKSADTCLDFVKFLREKGGYGPNGLTAVIEGFVYVNKGDSGKADTLFDYAIKRGERISIAYMGKGFILYSSGRLDAAANYFEKAVKADPKNGTACFFLSQLAFNKGRYSESLRYSGKALRLNPHKFNEPRILSVRGASYAMLGRYKEGITDLDRALKMAGDDTLLRSNIQLYRGYSLYKLDRDADALKALKESERLQPSVGKDENFNAIIGGVLYDLDMYEQAIVYIKKALEMSPKRMDVNIHIMKIYGLLKRHEEVIKHYQKLIKMGIDDAEVHFQAGLNYKEVGLLDKADSCLKKAVELKPKSVRYGVMLNMILGNRYLVEEKFKEALRLVDKIISLDPKNIVGYEMKARVLVLMNRKYTKAVKKVLAKGLAVCSNIECEAVIRYAKADIETVFTDKDVLADLKWFDENKVLLDRRHMLAAVTYFERGDMRMAMNHVKAAEAVEKDVQTLFLRSLIESADNPQTKLDKFVDELQQMYKGDEMRHFYVLSMAMLPILEILTFTIDAMKGKVKDAKVYYNVASFLDHLNKRSDALKFIDKYLNAFPNDYKGHWRRGLILYDLLRFSGAAEAFGKALKLRPKEARLHYLYGISLGDTGRYEDGLNYFESALRLKPDMRDALIKRCLFVRRVKGKEDGMRCIDDVISRFPKVGESYRIKAEFLFEEGRFKEALKLVKKSVELYYYNYASHSLLGKIQLLFGRLKEAVGAFSAALKMRPGLKHIRLLKALALIQLGKFREALDELDELTRQDPNNRVGYLAKGLVLIEGLKDYDEAVKVLEKLVKLAPKEYKGHYYLSKAYFKSGKFSDALKLLDVQLLQKLNASDPYLLKAIVEFRLKRYDAALTSLEKAVDLGNFFDPYHVSASSVVEDLKRDIKLAKGVKDNLDSVAKLCSQKMKVCKEFFKTGGKGSGRSLSYPRKMQIMYNCLSLAKECDFDLGSKKHGIPHKIWPLFRDSIKMGPIEWQLSPKDRPLDPDGPGSIWRGPFSNPKEKR